MQYNRLVNMEQWIGHTMVAPPCWNSTSYNIEIIKDPSAAAGEVETYVRKES